MNSNIYFLINSLTGGGAERQVSLLANHLPNTKIVCLFKEQSYEVAESKIHSLYSRLPKSGLIRLLLLPFILLKLKKNINVNKHTHIISFLQLSNILGICCKIIWRCRLTVSIRTTTSVYYKNYNIGFFTKSFDRLIFRYADFFVTNSLGSKQDLIDNFGIAANKISVIVNAYDFEEIELLKQRPIEDIKLANIFTNYKVILSVGRLAIEKGLEQGIFIFSEVAKKNNKLKYVIIGEGGLKPHLKKVALNLGLYVFDNDAENFMEPDKYDIFFLGFQKNPYQFYYRSYLFLYPSLFEGMPNALAEAFICGTLCVSADCKSGPREILSSLLDVKKELAYPFYEYGYLLPVLNTTHLKNKKTAEIEIWINLLKNLAIDKTAVKCDWANYENKKMEFAKEKILEKWERIAYLD